MLPLLAVAAACRVAVAAEVAAPNSPEAAVAKSPTAAVRAGEAWAASSSSSEGEGPKRDAASFLPAPEAAGGGAPNGSFAAIDRGGR